ncbi:MAG: VWA domain-containing protein [Acidobacteria bacterium]|nr:VWA domain-containing protein [Acidobacteriota bacterium]
MQRRLITLAILLVAASAAAAAGNPPVTQGSLEILGKDGKFGGVCPLKQTDVKAEISGFLARVNVTQEFWNPLKEKIEAVYVFPLPQNAAVDDMTMLVGDRTVKGLIKRREEARNIYEAARRGGQVAALLDQERPNIFTQSVANILPGERVRVTISYVELLKYEDGAYEFVFPMVVGPRYIPGDAGIGSKGGGWALDTDRVPDASRITPPVAPKGTRAGHDISIQVSLDAGVPIQEFRSTSHEIDFDRTTPRSARVNLRRERVIPNKDFILRYDVAGGRIEDAVLVHKASPAKPKDLRSGGFFTLILQPPDRIPESEITPKEIVFVLDTSGSMSGFPIEKAKEAMKLALEGMHPEDTFNLITFSGDTHILFPEPVPATAENLKRAQQFLASRSGSGGTEMMKAIRAALDPSDSQEHLRVVCFMTDGYVGNDMEIIAEVQKHPNARVFSFGIGSSVNRFLLDKMAEAGRGEVEYVALTDDGSAAARRFHERVRTPLLTDLEIQWNGIPIADVYPKRLPDLFSAKPVILTGRYGVPSRGLIRLRGKRAGEAFARDIRLDLPAAEPEHDVLATLWARQRIDHLMAQDWNGAQQGNMQKALQEQVTDLGLQFRLMTQFTSFVAVEEMVITDGGEPRTIQVPVEMPEGVSHEGVFGERLEVRSALHGGVAAQKSRGQYSGSAGGIGYGSGGVIGPGRVPASQPAPPPAQSSPSTREAAAVPRGKDDEDQLNRPAMTRLDRDRRAREAKLAPDLLQVMKCLEKEVVRPYLKHQPGTCKIGRDSKLEVQVWLADKSAKTLGALKALGFEVVAESKATRLLIGRLPASKLSALIRLDAVQYVAPQEQGAIR